MPGTGLRPAAMLPHRDGGAEVWGEWTQWSYCSKSCVRALGLDREAVQEGGIRSRRRHVLTAGVLMEACDLRCRGAKPPREAGPVCYERESVGRQCDAEIKETVEPCNTQKRLGRGQSIMG